MARSRREPGKEVWLTRRTGFRPEYIDFDNGIRVGHLEPEERITRIVKARLERRHGVRMICDRWGRGVFWQWICWVPEPNRGAKPLSSRENFASSKFFIAVDRESRTFQSGLQVEHAPKKPRKADGPMRLERDWDWNVLLAGLRGPELPRKIGRLVREGFRLRMGPFNDLEEFTRKNWKVEACLRSARRGVESEWGGLQLFWPMSEAEVRASEGKDLVESILAVFEELVGVANLCMYSPCLRVERGPTSARGDQVADSESGSEARAIEDEPLDLGAFEE